MFDAVSLLSQMSEKVSSE